MSGPGKGADHRTWKEALAALDRNEEPEVFVRLADESKAARKAVSAVLSGEGGRAIREKLADAQGLDRDTNVDRLLRLAAGREGQARERSNPIAINEAFECAHCSFAVPPAPGSAVRNHCPRCLRSLHLDAKVPGDRSSNCGGIMDPEGAIFTEGNFRVTHRCRRCGFTRRNRLATDWAVEPDRTDSLWPERDSKLS